MVDELEHDERPAALRKTLRAIVNVVKSQELEIARLRALVDRVE